MAFKEPFSLFEISTSIHASSCYFCVALKGQKPSFAALIILDIGHIHRVGLEDEVSLSDHLSLTHSWAFPNCQSYGLGLGGTKGLSGYVTASNNNMWLDESCTVCNPVKMFCMSMFYGCLAACIPIICLVFRARGGRGWSRVCVEIVRVFL